jgi:hypothetical protein
MPAAHSSAIARNGARLFRPFFDARFDGLPTDGGRLVGWRLPG